MSKKSDTSEWGWNPYNRNILTLSNLQQTMTTKDKRIESEDGITLSPKVIVNPSGLFQKINPTR